MAKYSSYYYHSAGVQYARRRCYRSSWERTDHTFLKNVVLGLLATISMPLIFILAIMISKL